MANQFSGDAGFEWNPKVQTDMTHNGLSYIPDGIKSVYRLRFRTRLCDATTYHLTAKDVELAVRLCLNRKNEIISLSHVKVEDKSSLLREIMDSKEESTDG